MIQQLSPEWVQARCGKVTASRVSDLMARTKSGWGASRYNYMAELIAERLTGRVAESYTNSAIQWGQETEQEARDAYQFYTGLEVEQAGFILHPNIADFGASPDGLVGDDGLVEIKCPNTATHIETLLSGTIPGKYITQMFSQITCTGREWCDFVSFDPRMPENLRMFKKRLERHNDQIQEILKAVDGFQEELLQKIERLYQLEIYEDNRKVYPSLAGREGH